MLIHLLLTAILLPLLAVMPAAETVAQPSIQERLETEIASYPGRIGICARHLETGEEIRIRADEKFPSASVIKTPVMVEFFIQQAEGKVHLDDTYIVKDEDKVGGSGTIQNVTGEVELTFREAIELMITVSDNTTTNVVIDGIGGLWEGIHAMNRRMEELGLKYTRLMNKMMSFKTKTNTPDSLRYGVGVTTPEDQALLYELIYRGKIVNEEVSNSMLEVLLRQKYNSIIPGELPQEDDAGIQVAHKTGSIENAVLDAGIVLTPRGNYVIALFADGTEHPDWPGVRETSKKLAQLSRMVYDHFISEQ